MSRGFANASAIVRARAAGPIPKGMPSLFPMKSGEIQHASATQQLESYRFDVYKAVRFKASQLAKLDRSVYQVDIKGTAGKVKFDKRPLVNHATTLMLARGARGMANPFTGSGTFLSQISIDLDLNGNFYGVKIRSPEMGDKPVWTVRLRPDFVRLVPDGRTGIAAYMYRPKGSLSTKPIFFDPAEIVHIKHPNPIDDRIGWSPLMSLGYSVDMGESIRRFQWMFFEQGAHIDGVITGIKNTQELEKLYEMIGQRHYRGADSAWLPMPLLPEMEFKETQQGSKDLQMPQLLQVSKTDILEAIGVPEGLLGTVKDVSLANLRGLMSIFVDNGLIPQLSVIEEGFERCLLLHDWPELRTPSSYLEFDFEVPDASDPDQKRKDRESRLKTYLTTVNQEREEMDEEPVPWGDLPIGPASDGPLILDAEDGGAGDGDEDGDGDGDGDGDE